MNRNQWFVLGIGLIIFSGYMFWNASILGLCATSLNEITMMGCTIIKSAYVIPALISIVLGWLFIICAGLEPKKK